MGRVIHFEIHASDPDRAERFYTGIFGWSAQQMGGPQDYRLLTTGADDAVGINGAILRRMGGEPEDGAAVNAYTCTIEVDSIEDTERGVREAGGVQILDRIEIPGVGLLSYFKDTEGNLFGALQPVSG